MPLQVESEAEHVLSLQAVPPIDIRQILSSASSGQDIMRSLDECGLITRKERISLTQILVSFLIARFGESPNTNTKEALAQSLVQTFPCLNDGSDSGYEIWYTKSRRVKNAGKAISYPATGFIEERLRNVRKRQKRGSHQQVPEDSQPKKQYIPVESTMPEERSLQQKEWLKNNSEPFSQVQLYMKDTVLYRANWIRANNSKDVLEILTEYPHLTSPGMIEQDFIVMHAEASPKLREMWLPEYAEKILHLAEKDGKLPSFDVDMTLDAKGELSLRLLPEMMPQVVYKVGKKSLRHTNQESRAAFIQLMPVGTNVVEYLTQPKPYPSVLALGEPQECASQVFVVFAGQALPQPTLLGAVDVCFKAFYIFDINYPKECSPCWEFLQQVVYKIEGPETKPVKFLKTALLNCKLE